MQMMERVNGNKENKEEFDQMDKEIGLRPLKMGLIMTQRVLSEPPSSVLLRSHFELLPLPIAASHLPVSIVRSSLSRFTFVIKQLEKRIPQVVRKSPFARAGGRGLKTNSQGDLGPDKIVAVTQ